MHADETEERGREPELADELGMGDVGDVEDDQARLPVGEVGERTFHVRRPVQRDVALRFLAARHVLPRHPPAAGLDRLRRVSDVHDHVDVAAVARHSRGQMHIASARIEVAVRAGPSGLVLPEALRPHRVQRHGLDGPGDDDARVVDERVEPLGQRARRCLDRFGVGHIEDRPATMPEVARVEIPAAVALLDRELERRSAIDVAVADHAHIARHRPGRDLSEGASDEEARDEARERKEAGVNTHRVSFL